MDVTEKHWKLWNFTAMPKFRQTNVLLKNFTFKDSLCTGTSTSTGVDVPVHRESLLYLTINWFDGKNFFGSEFLVFHAVLCGNLLFTLFWQKFRESNAFTKETAKHVELRKLFLGESKLLIFPFCGDAKKRIISRWKIVVKICDLHIHNSKNIKVGKPNV